MLEFVGKSELLRSIVSVVGKHLSESVFQIPYSVYSRHILPEIKIKDFQISDHTKKNQNGYCYSAIVSLLATPQIWETQVQVIEKMERDIQMIGKGQDVNKENPIYVNTAKISFMPERFRASQLKETLR